MEFTREEGLIRADFARHAWRLLKHYEELTNDLSPDRRYEATLTLCVLQSLLTNCWELYRFLGSQSPRMLGAVDTFAMSLLADPEVEVIRAVPGETLDGRSLIRVLRNALSHPTMKDTDPPTTGYTSVEDGSGRVVRMRFTASPDLDSDGTLLDKARARTGGDPRRARIVTIELPIIRLTALAEEVALVLAQPAMDNWDGVNLVEITL